VKLDVTTLRRLSPLLDEVLDLELSAQEEWLAGMKGDSAELAPLLRELLSRQASVQTNDLLQSGPEFTVGGAAGGTADFSSGDEVGPYHLIREIGVGGMGVVWLAERSDGVIKRTVALKLPMVSLRRSVLLQRFERERDILASLTHPNIARLYDAGISGAGQPYLALEFVQGSAITQFAQENGLDCRSRVRLLLQVMDAVQFAHANLVIHRDIKPGNVLVTREGQALLLDFGIAKMLEGDEAHVDESELTRVGGRALTLAYAAPEQVEGKAISIATDVWALGVLLYELTTGIRPFDSRPGGTGNAILNAEPVRPSKTGSGASAGLSRSLAVDLDSIVLKALKKDVADRYTTVNTFAEDLQRWLQGQPVSAQPDSTWYRTRKFVGRHTLGVFAASLAVTALAVFSVSLNIQIQKVTRERDRAEHLGQFMAKVFKVADPNEEKGAHVTASALLDSAAANFKSSLVGDPEMKAQMVRAIGKAYAGLGAIDRAQELLVPEYESAKFHLGPDHPAALAVGAELVSVLRVKWQMGPAETLARDLLARQRSRLGEQSLEVAYIESDLAAILAAQSKFDEAVTLQRHALTVLSGTAALDELDYLNERSSLAFFMMRAGKSDPVATERIYRGVVNGYRAKLGSGNLKTLQATNNLAAILGLQGKFAEDAAILERALAEGRQTLGPEHQLVRNILNSLAAAYVSMGDFAKAEPLLRESLALNVQTGGEQSPSAAMAKYNLACLMARRGDKDAALGLAADALDHGLIPDAALQMETDEDLATLRGDPRFAALVSRAKQRYGKTS
jgi:serine/threonine-protein kinase